MNDTYELHEQIVIAVMDELSGRKGIFSDIDEDVMQEITETLLGKVRAIIETNHIIDANKKAERE